MEDGNVVEETQEDLDPAVEDKETEGKKDAEAGSVQFVHKT